MYAVPQIRPKVVGWYIAYCIVMAVIYLAVVGLGVFLFSEGSLPAETAAAAPEVEMFGWMCLIIGLPLFAVYAAAPFLGRAAWVWTYGMVLIAIGCTSACCMLASIPLIIFWLKPETKAYFVKDRLIEARAFV